MHKPLKLKVSLLVKTGWFEVLQLQERRKIGLVRPNNDTSSNRSTDEVDTQ